VGVNPPSISSLAPQIDLSLSNQSGGATPVIIEIDFWFRLDVTLVEIVRIVFGKDADGRSQFFKSKKPASVERGTSDYSMVRLEASSSPLSADVYLVPAYIWDLGDNNATPPSHLDDSGLRDFMQEHFDYLQGETNLQKDVIEQKYTVLFVLGKKTKKRTLDARIGVNHISETFDHR